MRRLMPAVLVSSAGLFGACAGKAPSSLAVLNANQEHTCSGPSCAHVDLATFPQTMQERARAIAAATEYPYVACFDPDNPPDAEIIAMVSAIYERALEQQFYTNGRWSGTLGTPRALTWSFVPDGTQLPGLNTGDPTAASNLFSSMDSKFGGNRALWIAQFDAVFARWSDITGLTYTRITTSGNDWDDGAAFPGSNGNASRGDVRIGSRALDGASGVLAFNYFPSTGDMVLDSAENWGSATNSYRFLRNTLSHEHGHGMGLRHVCSNNSGQLMEPFLSTSFDGPREDDVRGSRSLYGDIFEPNNTTGAATPLGSLSAGGPALSPAALPTPNIPNGSSTSIDVNGDLDIFSVSVPEPLLVDVSITPIGSTYDDSPQDNFTGACTSGTTTDALAEANLVLDVRSGTTVLQSANLNGAGLGESLSTVLLSPAGDFLVRVSESGTPGGPQMYTLSVSNPRRATLSASDGTSQTQVDLSWTSVPGASGFQIARNTVNNRATASVILSLGSGVSTAADTTATPGVTYYYWVEASQSGSSMRALAGPDTGFRQPPPLPVPGNNACGSAAPLTFGVVTTGTTLGATTDGSSPCGGTQDVYYSLQTSCNSLVTVTTAVGGTSADTVLSIHTACPTNAANQVTCINTPGGPDTLSFSAIGGQTYIVRVATINPLGANFSIRASEGPRCGDIDFNNDDLSPDDADLIDLLNVIAGGACSTDPAQGCDTIDYNGDGLFPDEQDIIAFLTVLAGGDCPCS